MNYKARIQTPKLYGSKCIALCTNITHFSRKLDMSKNTSDTKINKHIKNYIVRGP